MKAMMVGTMAALMLLAALVLATPTSAAVGTSGSTPDKININTAGVDEFVALPGIGRAYAERIVEYRQKNGPFKRLEDLLNVRGIGEKTYERIKDRVTLGKS